MKLVIRINRPEPFRFFEHFPIAMYWKNVKKSTGDELLDEALDIFSNQRNWIVRIALKYLNRNETDAEDVAQNFALELFDNKELRTRFVKECREKISKYFYSIIKHKAVDLYEKNKISLDLLLEQKSIKIVEGKEEDKITYVDLKDIEQPTGNPFREMHSEEIINLVNELKGYLSDNSRNIIDLRMKLVSINQICWLLNISKATYHRHWNKAKKEFMSLLKKHGYAKDELFSDERKHTKQKKTSESL